MGNKVYVEGAYDTLLSASATGAGTALELPAIKSVFTMQTVTTGTPATVSVTLEGSLNNSTWFTLATSTSTTGDAQHAVDKPCRFVRANLGTLTGGTAPTVTVRFAAV